MDIDGDELAGVVDLFGSLSHEQLLAGLRELAFRRGEDVEDGALEPAVDDAVERFYLVAVDDRLVAGPAAFPELPDGAEDLPHILDVERRPVDRDAAAAAAERRFRAAAAAAVEAAGDADDGHGSNDEREHGRRADDEDRLRELLDVSYDLEAWGPVDVSDARAAIDRTLEG